MIDKIKKAFVDGIFLKKLLNYVYNKINDISIFTYRFRITTVSRKIKRKLIENGSIDKKRIEKNILKIEEFNDLKNYIDFEQQNQIVKLADKYLAHEFNILGSGKIILEPINWHQDFKSGYIWQKGKFYKDYNQENVLGFSDVKVPRELSRCHHFLILGQAYLITKNEKYTKEYIKQINNWIDENPLMYSINWGCTMDVAIRAINWIWSLSMFINSEKLSVSIVKKILISLYEHGFFISRNPEKSSFNNHNHYISDLVGQIYLGLLFQDLSEPRMWLNLGVKELFREMRTQILPSGPSYERSTNYHRLVAELFTSAILVLKNNNFEIPLDIRYRLEKMHEFIMYYTKPDGTAPIIGDQDDGRLHPFSISKNIDHRQILSVGSIIFNRADFKKYSNGYNSDCLFLLGSNSKNKFDILPDHIYPLLSRRFPDAGFFIMRSKNYYMFINNSGKGRYSELNSGTHTHSDLLSFVLYMENTSFLIDPGSYVYSANPQIRKLFRSTAMHNTVMVDKKDQNEIKEKELWNFERNAIPKLNNWESNQKFDFFNGEHSGYRRLEEPVTHRRTIYFDKVKKEWEIIDYLFGEGEHLFEWFFHFDVGIDFIIKNNTIITNNKKKPNIIMKFQSENINLYKFSKESGWVSKAYGKKEKALILHVSVKLNCPIKMTIKINKE